MNERGPFPSQPQMRPELLMSVASDPTPTALSKSKLTPPARRSESSTPCAREPWIYSANLTENA